MNKNKAWGGVSSYTIALPESIIRKKNNMKKGFTLIELLAVIVILAIIALIATPIVLDIIDSVKQSSVEATMKNIEKAALLEYSDLVLDGKEKEEIIYNCYDGKCTYNGKVLSVKGDMPDRGRIIVNEDGATFENIIIKGYNCIKENNKFTCNNTGLITVNGTNILIDNNKTTEIENYRIYGNSIQNGTPTPDIPVDIESVGDLVTQDNCSSYGLDACSNVGKYVIPIKVTGKNLFNYENSSFWKGANIEKKDNGFYKEKGQYTVFPTWETLRNYLGQAVTISFDLITGDDSAFLIYQYQGNGIGIRTSDITSYQKANEQKRITYGPGIVEVLNTISNYSKGEIMIYHKDYQGSLFASNIQMEIGNKATEYEPYKETITNIYLDEPLRSIGEYSDYIDFKNKKVVRRVKKLNINNILNWTDNYFPTLLSILNSNEIAKPNTIVLNNYSDKKRFGITNIEGTGIGFYNCDTYWNFNNLNEMKTWLDNNKNMYANYVLQNPIEQTLELPKLSINKNTSVISVNTSITPSNIELEYYR